MTIPQRARHSPESTRGRRKARKAHKARKARKGRHAARRSPPKYQPAPRPKALVEPPAPPIELTPLVACSADTAQDVLWHIAEHAPELRKWLVANPNANAELLEFVAQASGPGIGQALEILFESMDEPSTT